MIYYIDNYKQLKRCFGFWDGLAFSPQSTLITKSASVLFLLQMSVIAYKRCSNVARRNTIALGNIAVVVRVKDWTPQSRYNPQILFMD